MCLGGRFGSSLVSGVELEVDSESPVVAPRLSSSVSGAAWRKRPLPRQEGAEEILARSQWGWHLSSPYTQV